MITNTRPNSPCILIGEDELEVRQYLEMTLRCLGYRVELAENGNEVIKCLQTSEHEISLVLLDIIMPELDGFDTLREIRRMSPTLPVIVIAGGYMPTNVVTVMKCGATDFLCKPLAHEDLKRAICKALEGIDDSPRPIGVTAPKTNAFLGGNKLMREIYSLVGQIGWSEAPVLIQGETGTGKEVLARELHVRSPRSSQPFLKLNCAALPSELVESELFGYERGAFTGAFQKKAGMFELADGGTILLDEIGDMDVRLQSKLLQVLQDQQFQRIGGKEMITVDVRVLAATHRNLETAIADRTFREDLFYRLNVISLLLPPLRERQDDIVPLAEFLLKKHSPANGNALLTLELKEALLKHNWPGNVRELENVIRKLIVLRDPELIVRDLQLASRRKSLAAPAIESRLPRSPEVSNSAILEQVTIAKEQAETEAILTALNATRWNRKRAAIMLGIDYKALLYKMKKLGVEDSVTRMPPAKERDGAGPDAATLPSNLDVGTPPDNNLQRRVAGS